MKIGNRSEKTTRMVNPNKNQSKKNLLLVGVIVVTVLLIIWVYIMGKKAEDTVSVVMWTQNIYKNEVITESKMMEHKMLKGEFEKYAISNNDGSKSRRIVLWEERNKLYNTFAAYPLQANTICMIKDIVTSRTDNSDTVLYSFPGKNIIALKLGESDLSTFKTFIQPGDRVNITAIYTSKDSVEMSNGDNEDVESIRQETVFKDIMVADLLNSKGNSVLDLYAQYNEMTTYQQANLDADESWQDSIQPSTLLVALTPEEELLYYEYLSKGDVEFYMSLPQRID